MRENPIRQIWGEGKWVLNAWCAIPSPFAAEVMANLGWDSVTVDMQHGVNDYQSAVGMFQAISTTRAAPMARVPWNDPAIVMKMLDAGAYGLICPLVNSAEEAERFAKACRYPPRGYRSSGPIRALIYGGADYFEHADDTIVAFAMIETVDALDNLDAILAVDEIDAVYIGPSDLSLSLGCKPGLDRTETGGGRGHRDHPRRRQAARKARRHPVQRHRLRQAHDRIRLRPGDRDERPAPAVRRGKQGRRRHARGRRVGGKTGDKVGRCARSPTPDPTTSCPDLFRASTSLRRLARPRPAPQCRKTWMPGTSPGMTWWRRAGRQRGRDPCRARSAFADGNVDWRVESAEIDIPARHRRDANVGPVAICLLDASVDGGNEWNRCHAPCPQIRTGRQRNESGHDGKMS